MFLRSGCPCSTQVSWLRYLPEWHFFSYAAKRQPTQGAWGPRSHCMLMFLKMHILALFPHAQYGQIWHLSTLHTLCREDWSLAFVVNHTIVTDPAIWQPGFNLTRHTSSLLNRLWTRQGLCHANLHKLGLAKSSTCNCGQQQTMNHIVDTCPLTKFDCNYFTRLKDDSIKWLESIVLCN